ncbi:hypothetical protein XENORESO_013034 [Xenotaenia resolanae]|uniref:Uncharacterized protein n=1 Tax=Xenotaenia resolanae TaxID=208358 RepID=A0ABV0WKD6_9TELE
MCTVCSHVTSYVSHCVIVSATRSKRDGDIEKMEEISNIEAAVELVEGGEEQLIPKESGFSKDDVEQNTAATRFGSGSGGSLRLWVQLVVVWLVLPFIYRYRGELLNIS